MPIGVLSSYKLFCIIALFAIITHMFHNGTGAIFIQENYTSALY